MMIFATDYDGTVTYRGVTPELLETVAEWRRRGNLFGIVSGRPDRSVREAIEGTGLDVDFVVSNNGAVVTDRAGKLLSLHPFDPSVGFELVNLLASEPRHVFYRVDGGLCGIEKKENYPAVPEENGFSIAGVPFDCVTESTVDYPDYETSLTAIARAEKAFPGKVRGVMSEPTLVDYIPVGVGKDKGVKELPALFGVSPERTVVIGDGENDLDMLTCPDLDGYCVANAMPKVLSSMPAEKVVDSPTELLRRLLAEKA